MSTELAVATPLDVTRVREDFPILQRRIADRQRPVFARLL